MPQTEVHTKLGADVGASSFFRRKRKPSQPTMIRDDPIAFTKRRLICNRTVLPAGLRLGDEQLGKGSNNRVVTATWDDADCVVRIPRRRSDTQQKGAAVWEARHTLLASQIGAGPTVLGAWYAKHATRDFPSGLYVVSERYPDDLEDVLMSRSRRPLVTQRSDDVASAVVDVLARLAAADMFLYDLKPSNLVIRMPTDAESPIDVRVIDFGREFCEWRGTQEPDASTPVVDMVDRLVEGDERVRRHVLFAAMLVQLAATTSHVLSVDRRRHRMDRDERRAVNGLAAPPARMLDSMQGRHVTLLREVLRCDEVRGVLAHYHGRRNAGTRRTLRLARGHET